MAESQRKVPAAGPGQPLPPMPDELIMSHATRRKIRVGVVAVVMVVLTVSGTLYGASLREKSQAKEVRTADFPLCLSILLLVGGIA